MTSINHFRFSIIAPAYNEEQYLPRLLDSIEVARANYSGGPNEIEVIVADNNSTDRTAEIAAARGEILCFIDGDSAIHPQTFDAIDRAITSGRYVGGSTGLKLERKSLGLLVTYCLAAPVAFITRMDSGVVFCRREDFEAVGGYDDNRLYAEDLVFLMALRRLGQSRRQRLTRLSSIKALGCTRKFDQFGDWHYFGMLGVAIKSLVTGNWHDENLANRYWYNSGR